MTDPVALLDQLDRLHAAATPGPWHVAKSGAIDAGDYDTVIGGGPVDCMSHCYGGTSTIEGDNLPADARVIVAAVNRLPQLTAALRAVLALADRLGSGDATSQPDSTYAGVLIAQAVAADEIRTAVATALSADPTNQEGTP